jgi:hypothetical protein
MEWRDYVVTYAAVVSTAVLIWQIFTWLRTGPRLRGSSSTNMVIYGAGGRLDEENRYVRFSVQNVGTADTTITSVGLYGYDGWWEWIRKRPSKAAVINHDVEGHPLPYVLKAGHTYTSTFVQTEQLEEWSRKMHLCGFIFHSFRRRPLLLAIRSIQKAATTPTLGRGSEP